VVQLAIPGYDPLRVLRDVASDEHFRGILVCGVNDRGFTPDEHSSKWFVLYYHREWTLNKRINWLITSALQNRLICLNSRVGLKNVAVQLHETHHLPKPLYSIRRADRSVQIDFQSPTIADELARDPDLNPRTDGFDIAPPDHTHAPPDLWLERAKEFDELAKRIQARGGKVAFIVMPVSGATLKTAEHYYPRKDYWDKFAAITSAETIHFQDVPALNAFDPPDTSHIDQRDAPAFTKAVCEELKRRNIFPRS